MGLDCLKDLTKCCCVSFIRAALHYSTSGQCTHTLHEYISHPIIAVTSESYLCGITDVVCWRLISLSSRGVNGTEHFSRENAPLERQGELRASLKWQKDKLNWPVPRDRLVVLYRSLSTQWITQAQRSPHNGRQLGHLPSKSGTLNEISHRFPSTMNEYRPTGKGVLH